MITPELEKEGFNLFLKRNAIFINIINYNIDFEQNKRYYQIVCFHENLIIIGRKIRT